MTDDGTRHITSVPSALSHYRKTVRLRGQLKLLRQEFEELRAAFVALQGGIQAGTLRTPRTQK